MDMNELKMYWHNQEISELNEPLNEGSLHTIIRRRTTKQKNRNMQYFWASFTYQIIVYSLFVYVGIKHWNDTTVVILSVLGALIYLPFTILLMHKFKQLAVLRIGEEGRNSLSLKRYVSKHYRLIKSFFKFKVIYEMVLIPVSTAIFVWIFFRIYFPGGAGEYPISALILFIAVVGACSLAIFAENQKNFIRPMRELEKAMREMEEPIGDK